jgi:hypothetical protein
LGSLPTRCSWNSAATSASSNAGQVRFPKAAGAADADGNGSGDLATAAVDAADELDCGACTGHCERAAHEDDDCVRERERERERERVRVVLRCWEPKKMRDIMGNALGASDVPANGSGSANGGAREIRGSSVWDR